MLQIQTIPVCHRSYGGVSVKKITLSMLFWDHVFSSGDDSSIGFTLKGCKLHE